jgi:glycosyltransferase involved in cell wall biosynthesis
VRRRPSERIVGYLGTFGAGQGLTALIDAARRLRANGSDVRLVMVGDGPDRLALEEDLRVNPVDGVTLHAPISRDDTRAFYAACDVVVVPHAALPVLRDTVPSKIFEVMACGRPLVAALRGEGERIIRESGGGVLAEPGDGRSLAEAIRRILTMASTEREALGAAGRAFALARYDRAGLAQGYLALLRRTVDGYSETA